MRKGLPGALGSKDPSSAPSSQTPPLVPAQPGEEIQCRGSKPARRVASAGLTREQGRSGAQASEMGKVGSKGEGSSSEGPRPPPWQGILHRPP